jgi:hypothetical protein
LTKKTETEPKPGQTDRFRFGSICFLGKKPVQTGFGSVFSVMAWFFPVLARFSRFWLGFSGLAQFWLVFFGFGSVFSVFCL